MYHMALVIVRYAQHLITVIIFMHIQLVGNLTKVGDDSP